MMTVWRCPWIPMLLTLLLVAEPVLAQGIAGFGQATGSRRQISRTVTNLPVPSFQQQQPGMEYGQEVQKGETMRYGAPGMDLSGTDYQIHLLGQVRLPGTYRFPASIRLDEAIKSVGGIVDRGSHRRIELRRGGTRSMFDLLFFRMRGELAQNPFLLDNDVIFVPYAKNVIQIDGPIRSPGKYELVKKESTLWDVIELAGGYTTGAAALSSVTIIRYDDTGKKELIEVPNNEASLRYVPLENGDVIVIPHIFTADRKFDYNLGSLPADNIVYPSFNDNVFVLGAVELPGAYPFNPHYGIRDFVNMAGPVRHAKMRGIKILTNDGKQIGRQRFGSYHLSPGDTIVVPEKVWTVDNTIKWYNTLANSVITGFTLRELIRR